VKRFIEESLASGYAVSEDNNAGEEAVMSHERSHLFGPRVFVTAGVMVLVLAAWLVSGSSDSAGATAALVAVPAFAVVLFYGGIAWTLSHRHAPRGPKTTREPRRARSPSADACLTR
jgi:hypothetical protein